MHFLFPILLLATATRAVDLPPADSGSVPTASCGHAILTPLVDDQSTPHDSIPHSWPWVADMCYQCEEWSRFQHSGDTMSSTTCLL
jgi:hypothetical protein